MLSSSDRESKIRDVLLRVRPPFANEQVLQAWREGVAQGVTETMLDEQKRIAAARAEDQQRLFHYETALAIREEQIKKLSDGIREHRDARGDDRCWRDDVTLYQLLPEGFAPEKLDSYVELERCKDFIACRQNPSTNYVSPQRRIEALIEVVKACVCHSVDCAKAQDAEQECSCGIDAKLAAAGLPAV